MYDTQGEEGLKQMQQQQQGGGGFNPFGGFFNQNQEPRKGPSINMDLDVTLEDLYLGTTVELELAKQVICEHCRGTGARSEKDVESCKVCGGKGVKHVKREVAPGFFMQQQET